MVGGWPQVVDLVKEYNQLGRGCVAIMLDTKGPEVRSGDLAAPIDLIPGAAPCPPLSPPRWHLPCYPTQGVHARAHKVRFFCRNGGAAGIAVNRKFSRPLVADTSALGTPLVLQADGSSGLLPTWRALHPQLCRVLRTWKESIRWAAC